MSADAIDLDHLRGWIGRTEIAADTITEGLVARFRATLGAGAVDDAEAAPLGIHWCLAPPAAAPSGLGQDGHPAKGEFLPPIPLPRRMWAGGSLSFVAPLRTGDVVTRTSRIADVTAKSGRSGNLVFVTVEHETSTPRGVAIRERQDIVYREMQSAQAAPVAAQAPRDAEHSESVEANTVLLFRYSALTFNGHRIHYDRDYARDVEGYSGLVVHGPLQATLLLHFAARLNEGICPAQFSYRGQAPLNDGQTISLNAVRDAKGLELWTAGANGATAMSAQAEWPS